MWFAYQPLNLGAAYGDLQKYEQWAGALTDDQLAAYSAVQIEYPPGVLPFLVAAEKVKFAGEQFGHRFIWVMAFLDLLGFLGILLLAQRWRSSLGAWVWIAAIPLLGPIAYLRLDLVPAVATIFAIERASAGSWGAAGGLLGYGAIAKVYPAFLLFPAIEVVKKYRRFLLGATLAVGVVLAPFLLAGSARPLIENVAEYHLDRGIQVESTWGFLLLAATKFGYDMYPTYQFGANEAISALSDTFKGVGLVCSIGALAFGWWSVARNVKQGDVPLLTVGMFGLLSLLMFFGTVFSPQYVVWLIALGAAALCHPLATRLRRWILIVLPIAAVTQIVFPFTIGDVLDPFYNQGTEAGSTVGLVTLGVRNALVFAAGAGALWSLRSTRKDERTVVSTHTSDS